MGKRYRLLSLVLFIGACIPLQAASVGLGLLGLMGYTNVTQQTVEVFNFTGDSGSGPEDYCHNVVYSVSASPAVCSALNFSDWHMLINYTDEAGTHSVSYDPTILEPVIAPASGYLPFTGTAGAGQWTLNQSCPNTDPTCSSSSPVTFPPFPTTITSVVFTGRVAPGTSVTLNVPTGSVLAATTFTATLTPTISSGGADVGEGFIFYDQAEILLDVLETPPPTGGVPEPSSLSLLVVGSLAAGISRVIRRSHTNTSQR